MAIANCYRLNVSAPQHSYVEASPLDMIVCARGGLWEVGRCRWSPSGGTSMTSLCPSTESQRPGSLTWRGCRGREQEEGACLQTGKGPHQTPNLLPPWSRIPASGTVRNMAVVEVTLPVVTGHSSLNWLRHQCNMGRFLVALHLLSHVRLYVTGCKHAWIIIVPFN